MRRKRALVFSLIFITPAHGDDFRHLAARCAPQIAFSTLKSLVRVESSFNPYAINVNYGDKVVPPTTSLSDALKLLKELESKGANFDVGLTQINSKNFGRLSLTAEQLLDPCTNLRAGAQILKACYVNYFSKSLNVRGSLLKALSCYNSGNEKKGFDNGYVFKILSTYPDTIMTEKDIVPGIDWLKKASQTLETVDDGGGEVDIFGPGGVGTPDVFSAPSP